MVTCNDKNCAMSQAVLASVGRHGSRQFIKSCLFSRVACALMSRLRVYTWAQLGAWTAWNDDTWRHELSNNESGLT